MLNCVPRAPLLLLRSQIVVSFKVCRSVRHRWQLTRSPLFPSNKIFWPYELNYLWSKKIYRPKMIVWSGATFILRWSCFYILPYFPQRNLAFLNKYLRPKSPQGCFRQNFYFHRWSSTTKRNMSIIIFHRVFFEVAEKENSLGVNQFHSFWNILHPRFWR